jgi:outer membrane protein
MKRLLTFFLLPLFCCTSLFADELSLTELIDIALKNNPETEKVWSNVKRAQAVVGTAQGPLYPHLNAQGSVSHAREVKFPNGRETVFTNYGGELNLNYLLFDFGETRAAIRATKEGLKSAKWWADFAIQKVISEVAANYYELLNARELLETRDSSLKDAKMILEAAEELRHAGLRSEHDYITAKVAVSEILMNLTQQKAAAAIAYGKLLTSLGLPIDAKLQIQTHTEEMENPLFEQGIPALIATAEEQRADLMAKQASLADMNARVDRAKRAPLPKLRALGQAGWLQYAKHKDSSYNYSAGAALDIPLFQGFEYTYQKRQALADAEITAAELKELQNAIALEVLSYSELAKAAKEAMEYSEDFFADAFRSYDCSLESYKAGLINIFDLLQTQRYLSDARNRKAQAKTQWLVSLSQLAFATGSLTK